MKRRFRLASILLVFGIVSISARRLLSQPKPTHIVQCEPDSCGAWEFQNLSKGAQGTGHWDTGTVAILTITQVDAEKIVVQREDREGPGKGIMGQYVGRFTQDHIEGSFTWSWPGHGALSTGRVDWIAAVVQEQDDQGVASPLRIAVCEKAPDGCSTWMFRDADGQGQWTGGSTSNLRIRYFGARRVWISRTDLTSGNPTLLAIYIGSHQDERVRGTVVWLWPGHGRDSRGATTWSGKVEASSPDLIKAQEATGGMPPQETERSSTGGKSNECDDGGHLPINSEHAVALGNQAATDLDERRALECFSAAANDNNASAQVDMAYAYEKGIGVAADSKIAFGWYLRAANNDNTAAQFDLARLYTAGIGTPANKSEADRWTVKMWSVRNMHDEVCSQLRVRDAMSQVELRSISDNASKSLVDAIQLFTGVDLKFKDARPELILSHGMDRLQARGRFHVDMGLQTGDFLCDGFFLRGHLKECKDDDPHSSGIKVCTEDDAGVDTTLTAATAKILIEQYPWYKEVFRLRPLADGRYSVTLVPTSIQLSKTYAEVTR